MNKYQVIYGELLHWVGPVGLVLLTLLLVALLISTSWYLYVLIRKRFYIRLHVYDHPSWEDPLVLAPGSGSPVEYIRDGTPFRNCQPKQIGSLWLSRRAYKLLGPHHRRG